MSNADGPLMMDDATSTLKHDKTLSLMPCEERSGQWSLKCSYAGLKNQQQSLCHHAHSSKDVLCVIDCNARLSPSSYNHQSTASKKSGFNASLKVTSCPSLKSVGSFHDKCKQFDSMDNSDVTDEGKESGTMLNVPMSENLMSEHKRRKKLDERLYSLRALVPNLNKNLQTQIDKIQEDIADLGAHKEGPAVVGSGDEDPRRNNNFAIGSQKTSKKEHQILKLEVSLMEGHIYHLHIHCKNTPGVLIQLTRAIEALELDVLNAIISSVDDHILNTVVGEVKNGSVMRSEELRDMARAVISKFGFSFC